MTLIARKCLAQIRHRFGTGEMLGSLEWRQNWCARLDSNQ